MAGIDRNVALAEALQKALCAGRILIQQRCCGGEQQDLPIAGLRAHRLLGQRQKTRMEARIGESSQQNWSTRRPHPSDLHASPLPADRQMETVCAGDA